ncbi:pseudo histidine-containing phosphotransfer protein 1 [Hevea brasiliensis]|nr:pseudo histidine-containing phosphotransfer protein 1 [Hevea brasiliensis]
MRLVKQLREKCGRLGAQKVMEKAIALLGNCSECHVERSKASLQMLKLEIETLKAKLDPYFQLVRQARLANEVGAGPPQ